MTQQRLLQIRGLFDAALEQESDIRLEFLELACAGDHELLSEVQLLLDAHDQTGGLLDRFPLVATCATNLPSAPQMEGRRIGPYLIGRELGRGGMGVVYLAIRAEGAFRKQFALKVVQSSLASHEVIARFRREREILGSLDHPNIARLIDAGATDEGLPFYVVEFVEGKPIDMYCDEHCLNITKRIILFRKVCAAVQYAHQNLVVHRDLKPSNILVTLDGTVKLLDFGIAKLLEYEWQQTVIQATGVDIRLMTPEYASPEQIKQEPITTATDVYSLGVVLYELLTGHRPYRLKNRLLHEVERAICEEEPTWPSTVITEPGGAEPANELSAVREGTIARLKRRLSGDIDNILLVALRKEPRRRYPSAEQFGADLHRHLEGLPVTGRSDTALYRAEKFVLRHKLPVASATSFLLFLSGALAVTIRLYSKAKNAERSALEHFQIATAERQTAQTQTVLAKNEKNRAEVEAAHADEERKRAQARELWAWASASLADDSERALILGLYAWGNQRSMFSGLEQLLHDALAEPQCCLTLHGAQTVAWSPDGKKMAVANWRGPAKILDAVTGHELLTLLGSNGSIVWSPDGSKLGTAGSDQTVKVWDGNTGRELLSFRGQHDGEISWSPDGGKLAASVDSGTALWEASTGRPLVTLPISAWHIAWSPDGAKVATNDQPLLVHDAEGAK